MASPLVPVQHGSSHSTITYSSFLPGSTNSFSFSKKFLVIPPRRKSSAKWTLKTNCTLMLQERVGAAAMQGTGRPSMEDTYNVAVNPKGSGPSFFGVFDGHGGTAVAQMLKDDFWDLYKKRLSVTDPITTTISAYLEFDGLTLAQPKGFLGALRERGVGGSRCGATAATVVLFPLQDGRQQLVAANVGDARIVLSRAGQAMQLSFDHKVINVEGTWRVGGLLALSRAFGDAYLKDWSDGRIDGARGGYGLTAEPDVAIETLGPEDELIILGTDGLWEKIPNQEVVDICKSARASSSSEEIAKQLIKIAQERGATDDIAAIVVFLPQGGA